MTRTIQRALLRTGTAAAAASVVALSLAASAQAATPRDFDAPIFGTTATLTGARMPSVADIECDDEACNGGLLPRGVAVSPTKYLSTTIAAGGSFADAPGFTAKVNKSWSYTPPGSATYRADVTIILADFRPGTDLAAIITGDPFLGGDVPIGPTEINGIPTWTFTDTGAAVAYASVGTSIVRGACGHAPNFSVAGMCSPTYLTELVATIAASAAPSRIAVTPAQRALIPDTPAMLTPVVMSVERSPLVWSTMKPGSALTKALQPTSTVALQYAVEDSPDVLFLVTIAPVDGPGTERFVRDACRPTVPAARLDCRRTVLAGPVDGYVGTFTAAGRPARAFETVTRFRGGGRLGVVSCSIVNFARALTPEERVNCRRAVAALSAAVAG